MPPCRFTLPFYSAIQLQLYRRSNLRRFHQLFNAASQFQVLRAYSANIVRAQNEQHLGIAYVYIRMMLH